MCTGSIQYRLSEYGGLIIQSYYMLSILGNSTYSISKCDQYRQAVSLSLRRHYSVPRTWKSRDSYTYSTWHALTMPSSSRSPPLKGGGPSTYAAGPRCISITHALYFEIYTTLLEVIQLMSITRYEAYVCVCFFMYKTLCAAFIWLPRDARSCLYVCLYCEKKIFYT